jgi:hypothetical protein
MKTYLAITGLLFGLLTVVHIWRMFVEPGSRDPWLVLITIASAALGVWALRLFTRASRAQ